MELIGVIAAVWQLGVLIYVVWTVPKARREIEDLRQRVARLEGAAGLNGLRIDDQRRTNTSTSPAPRTYRLG